MSVIKAILKYLFATLFVYAGVMHFVRPEFFLKIMPPYLPWHLELVYISGVFEIILGVMLAIPKSQNLGAWGLIGLLIAVSPANIHMAMNPQLFPEYSLTMLYSRLFIQVIFILWAYWYTQKSS